MIVESRTISKPDNNHNIEVMPPPDSIGSSPLTPSIRGPVNSSISSSIKSLPPGSLSFGLKVGEHGQLEYSGPTSSITGIALPERHYHQIIVPEDSTTSRMLPSKEDMSQHIELFVEWQNSSILVLPACIIDPIMQDYPPVEESLETRAILWSVLSLTYKMHCINRSSYEERTFRSEVALNEAKKLVTRLAFRKPSTEVVTSACILACREYSCGQENSAWVFHGKQAQQFLKQGKLKKQRYCHNSERVYRIARRSRLRQVGVFRASFTILCRGSCGSVLGACAHR